MSRVIFVYVAELYPEFDKTMVFTVEQLNQVGVCCQHIFAPTDVRPLWQWRLF